MSDQTFQFDEIGDWSELKLEIVEKYGRAYTTAFKNTTLKKFYVDGFSGGGAHISRRTRALVEGSPARALKVVPPFDAYYFIDMNPEKTSYLKELCKGKTNTHIHTGDANRYLKQQLLPTIQRQSRTRALCLLDPYGLHLDWAVMFLAGKSRAVDLFLNFPVMDMNRNAIWRDQERVPQDGIDRMSRFWGDDSWRTAAYAESAQLGLFGPIIEKQSNAAIVGAFQRRLMEKAGFGFVPDPLPMRNSTNAIVYYLFFASSNRTGAKIINDIFRKYR